MTTELRQIVKDWEKENFNKKVEARLFNGWVISSEVKYINGSYQVLMKRAVTYHKGNMGA